MKTKVFLNFFKVNLFTLMTQGSDHERESPSAQKKHCNFHPRATFPHVSLLYIITIDIDHFIVCFACMQSCNYQVSVTSSAIYNRKPLIQTSVIRISTDPNPKIMIFIVLLCIKWKVFCFVCIVLLIQTF